MHRQALNANNTTSIAVLWLAQDWVWEGRGLGAWHVDDRGLEVAGWRSRVGDRGLEVAGWRSRVGDRKLGA
ncbi:hypothetical protein ACOMHN_062016 [Nucella lapillus]